MVASPPDRMWRRNVSGWVAVGVLWAGPSFAQSSEDALLSECYALRSRGQNDAALARCQSAVQTSRTGRSLTQLALTETVMERWVDAAAHLAEALADRNHPYVQQNRATIERAMVQVRPHVAEIEVTTDAPSAQVTVNGGAAVTVPRNTPLYALPGEVTLVGHTPGGAEARQTLTLTAGQATRVALTFPRTPPVVTPPLVTPPVMPVPVAITPPRTDPPAIRPVVVPPPREVPPPAQPTGSWQRTVGWVTAGGAVVGFGLALVGWRMRESAVDDYNGSCSASEGDQETVARCMMSHTQAADDVSTAETLTTVGLVAGGALAVASVVLFVTAPSSRRATPSAMRCGAGPGTVGLQCGVSF